MKWFSALLFSVFMIPLLHAQDFSGKYQGNYNGSPVVLELKSDEKDVYTGIMNDGQTEYAVSLTAKGNRVKGNCKAALLGFVFDLEGTLTGKKLSMDLSYLTTKINFELVHDVPDAEPPKSRPKAPVARVRMPADAEHDRLLVGRWVHESGYSSGNGRDGSMASQDVLYFLEDGRLADGGSQTVVGGGGWSGSSESAGTGVVEGVLWYNKGNQLYLAVFKDGQNQQVHLGKYYMEGNNMLVTGTDGTKMLYQKR